MTEFFLILTGLWAVVCLVGGLRGLLLAPIVAPALAAITLVAIGGVMMFVVFIGGVLTFVAAMFGVLG